MGTGVSPQQPLLLGLGLCRSVSSGQLYSSGCDHNDEITQGCTPSQTSLLPYRGHWAPQETFVRSGVSLRWGAHSYELMRQTFRPRSLEKKIRIIKISAMALTQETVSAESN